MRNCMGNANFGIKWKKDERLTDLDFADDIALLAENMTDLQEMTTALDNSALKVGLNINNKKTRTMQVFAQDPTTKIFIKNEEVADVSCFTFLGSIFTAGWGRWGRHQLQEWESIHSLQEDVAIWSNSSIDTKIKIKFFQSLVLPTVLYACETWKTNAKEKKKLDAFLTRCLRKILKISYRDRVTNEEVYQQTKARLLSLIIKERRLRYAGHVLRMKEQSRGHPRLQWDGYQKENAKGSGQRTPGGGLSTRILKKWMCIQTKLNDRCKLEEVEDCCRPMHREVRRRN